MKLTFEIASAFLEGYSRGLNWPDAWESHPKPGGPWSDGDVAMTAIRTAWRQGWDEGHAKKLAGIQ